VRVVFCDDLRNLLIPVPALITSEFVGSAFRIPRDFPGRTGLNS
jgi:hypothetical protein